MSIEIIEPGLSTTVQDQGRPGVYNVGIPQGGAMDQFSAEVANALVGNTVKEAVLEAAYLGPRLKALSSMNIAVTGAPVTVTINGVTKPQWERISLQPGDEVSFGPAQAGSRFYLAVSGGIDVPVVLGSRSTYTLGKLGGFQGRTLRAGDLLPVGRVLGEGFQQCPQELRPSFSKQLEVRVLRGLYDHLLSEAGWHTLVSAEWNLTPVADRTGLRYSGPEVEWKPRVQPFGAGSDPSNIVDAGYAVGSIQIPGGKEPIVLHRDAVSGGGYAMVATVISADLDLLARSAPGTKTRFTEVSMDQALAARGNNAKLREQLWTHQV
ncbi:biotin-dependent carboxylase-like uncharacterized protein [Psychromicrobium silvestre]|uniref:Biotin-dependent carboxylase-like uncharacterized protein n=1 Tax=Psychromicrobium silvestre TaxID=1645614 RepID=A0A7Y9S442_9MICC|nr:biotin-dependent carboxyltransferase family protein [Psychromicrobium silvestre]NYE94204.1 biotin-dependent carboxylase-like uncharacterized protein [Psychromicrobium silvestre]